MTNFGNRDKANDKFFSQKQRQRERKRFISENYSP